MTGDRRAELYAAGKAVADLCRQDAELQAVARPIADLWYAGDYVGVAEALVRTPMLSSPALLLGAIMLNLGERPDPRPQALFMEKIVGPTVDNFRARTAQWLDEDGGKSADR